MASIHILRLAQEGSAATTITRDCSRPLDGNHDGQPGGDYVANLSKGKVTPLAVPRTTAAAVDAALQHMSVSASPIPRRRR